MSRHIARYSITFGLSGCYMPNDSFGPVFAGTRRELVNLIRGELESHDMPASLFADVRITRLWAFIKRNGSSVAHFSLTHKGYELAFHGLTEAEANEMDTEN